MIERTLVFFGCLFEFVSYQMLLLISRPLMLQHLAKLPVILTKLYEYVIIWERKAKTRKSIIILISYMYPSKYTYHCCMYSLLSYTRPFTRERVVVCKDVINGLSFHAVADIYWHVKWEMIYSKNFCAFQRSRIEREARLRICATLP